MSNNVNTIKVKSWVKDDKNGFVVINEADFDKEKHELFVEGKKSVKAAEVSETDVGSKASSKMSIKELKALAKKNSIDITGMKTKDDILKAISEKNDMVSNKPNFASDEAAEKYVRLLEDKQFDADAYNNIDGTGEAGAITTGDIDDYVASLSA